MTSRILDCILAAKDTAARPNKALACAAVTLLLLILKTSDCSGGIIATTGAFQVVTPPLSVKVDQTESNTDILIFSERQNFVLSDAIEVDITQAPSTVTGSFNGGSPGFLAAGTSVNSYFIHFDTVGSNTRTATGTVTFEEEILGIIVRASRLNASDGVLGFPGTTYATGQDGRGTASGQDTEDTVSLSADRRTVSVDLRVGGSVDQVRIVTAAQAQAVPEPSSLVLAGIAISSLLGVHCLRRRNQ